jgi:hypothetical protein
MSGARRRLPATRSHGARRASGSSRLAQMYDDARWDDASMVRLIRDPGVNKPLGSSIVKRHGRIEARLEPPAFVPE